MLVLGFVFFGFFLVLIFFCFIFILFFLGGGWFFFWFWFACFYVYFFWINSEIIFLHLIKHLSWVAFKDNSLILIRRRVKKIQFTTRLSLEFLMKRWQAYAYFHFIAFVNFHIFSVWSKKCKTNSFIMIYYLPCFITVSENRYINLKNSITAIYWLLRFDKAMRILCNQCKRRPHHFSLS